MIKGVSRQIVEVQSTGNPYFERAFFVVKTPFSDYPSESLQHEAERAFSRQQGYSGLRRSRRIRRWKQAALLLGGCLVGLLAAQFLPL